MFVIWEEVYGIKFKKSLCNFTKGPEILCVLKNRFFGKNIFN